MRAPIRTALACLVSSVLAQALVPYTGAGQTVASPRPPGTLIDVGGYRLHLYCTGEGSPTVILEAGAGDFSFDWSLVQPAVASLTRVCSYDRAGYAWSDPGPTPRTPQQVVAELHALLSGAGETPPYVLVGHSLGGLYAQDYATQYPDEVRGVVLVEAVHEDNPIMLNGQLVLLRSTSRGRPAPRPRLEPPPRDSSAGVAATQPGAPSEVSSPYDRLPPATQELRRWAVQRPGFGATRAGEFDYLPEELAAWHEQRARNATVWDWPLIVVTRKDAPAGHAKRQADLVRLSSNGTQIIATTPDHHVQLEDPATVIGAINEVVAVVRGNGRLR